MGIDKCLYNFYDGCKMVCWDCQFYRLRTTKDEFLFLKETACIRIEISDAVIFLRLHEWHNAILM
jgi:hypothetical protein